MILTPYGRSSSQFWAGSYELRVIKRDEFFSPTMPKLHADHEYDHQKKNHLAHFELQVIFDYFWRNLTIFSLFDLFLANFLEIRDRRSIFWIFLYRQQLLHVLQNVEPKNGVSTSKAIFIWIFTAQFVDLCAVLALALKVNFLKFMLLFLFFVAKSHVFICKKI